MPGASASSQVSLVWPGMASILPASCGTQKEWITSPPISFSRTGTPDRNMDLVGGGEVLRPDCSPMIAHLPPPLPAGDLDGDGGPGGGAWISASTFTVQTTVNSSTRVEIPTPIHSQFWPPSLFPARCFRWRPVDGARLPAASSNTNKNDDHNRKPAARPTSGPRRARLFRPHRSDIAGARLVRRWRTVPTGWRPGSHALL